MWGNDPLSVFHGCDDLAAQSIAPVGGGHGVVLESGSPAKDFGQGFYTTTNVHQAEQWANRRLHTARRRGAKRAAVLRFTIEREALAKLDHMAFVRGDVAPNSDYWQLVSHCRSGKDHGRVEKSYYDVVYGPVSLFPSCW